VSFYSGRRVLVLGGLGFIGTHVTERAHSLGGRVTVVTRSFDQHREAIADFDARGVRVIEGDRRDARAMRAAVADQDVVFDFAGRSGAVRSMEDPWTDLDVNCRGTLVLLEALRAGNPAAKLVFVSSRLAYGQVGPDPADEDRATAPLDLHAVHKLTAEQYLRVYARTYGSRFTTARLTNPYGPGQPPGRTAYGVVNRLIHRAIADEPLSIYGDGRQRRDYVFIDDAVDALLLMGETTASDGRLYNVGSGVGIPIVEMARAITEIAGGGRIQFVPWPPLAEQIETGDFVASIARIRRELGWEPRVGLAEGLHRTVAFYKAHVA
jgi:UDP-glucose 4-epimerase